MSPVSTPSVTAEAPAAAVAVDTVVRPIADQAAALARVHQAADRYREAAAELEQRRQERQAAVLHANAVGASAQRIAEAAGISAQRMSWVLANATRRRESETAGDLPLSRRSGQAAARCW
jgi:response regulator of citrate/malate metabolism